MSLVEIGFRLMALVGAAFLAFAGLGGYVAAIESLKDKDGAEAIMNTLGASLAIALSLIFLGLGTR